MIIQILRSGKWSTRPLMETGLSIMKSLFATTTGRNVGAMLQQHSAHVVVEVLFTSVLVHLLHVVNGCVE